MGRWCWYWILFRYFVLFLVDIVVCIVLDQVISHLATVLPLKKARSIEDVIIENYSVVRMEISRIVKNGYLEVLD